MFHSRQLNFQPDLFALHQSKPDCYPYLLASNTSGEANTRYSILMAYPDETHIQHGNDVDVLAKIDTSLSTTSASELPFVGGWFVFLSYEYAALIEPSVKFHSADNGLPIAFISRIPVALIMDHEQQCCTIVAVDNRKELITQVVKDLEQIRKIELPNLPQFEIDEEDPEIYRWQLKKIHQYIRDGDIFQANLSRRWQVSFERICNPLSLYQRLCQSNPSPFAALVKYHDHYIISSSPERLICVRNGVAETRPIAGTHPRSARPQQDRELSQRLLSHPKERAEHVMLIDLERNDLGRICRPGSIRVKDKMVLETYQHVHHIVSGIVGEVTAGQSVKDVLHAVFPGGTITGCPKVRCMQIISEMEQTARGAYTGSLGYVSDDGQMDFNILIRTMSMFENKLEFRAGAGIVSDSITENELNETRHKARGMLNAIQSAY